MYFPIMKIHAVLHASFETVGVIDDWAKDNGHSLTFTHSYSNEKLPTLQNFDFLIMMGGPQSPLQQNQYPFLTAEIKLIRQAINAHKLVFGFCLGAQLIGEALYAKTLKSPEKEVGVFPITLTQEGKTDPLFKSFQNSFDVIHWHNDMPGIPEGALLLASSAGCPNQAFRYKHHVYGFQFHMEINKDNAKSMCLHCPDDLAPSKFTQTKELFLNSDFTSINHKMKLILDRFTMTNKQSIIYLNPSDLLKKKFIPSITT